MRLSVDDFGTGYSSLSRLLDLPLQELKIDRSFVTDIDGEGPGAAIVRSTIDLGHHSASRWWPRESETETTLAELRELGCDAVQGYHLLRPQPAAEVTVWLRQREAQESHPRPPISSSAMSKTLVVAEKPSVARDLASTLPGSFKQAKDKTHLETQDGPRTTSSPGRSGISSASRPRTSTTRS